MRTMMFSVFDVKSATYRTPLFMQREGMAIRAFADLVNEPDNLVAKHPEDFTLVHVGDFDDETAEIVSQKPRVICTAASLVKPSVHQMAESLRNVKMPQGKLPAEVH